MHSHIRGLGLDQRTLEPLADGPLAQGMVGQRAARRAAGVVVRLLEGSSTGHGDAGPAGRVVLLAGPPGTGKTAIAMAMAQSLGPDVPFTVLNGAEVFSRMVGKTEVLTQAIRRSVAIRLRETVELVEGEVVELVLERPGPDQHQQRGTRGKMTIKTTDMETVYDLGERLVEALLRERVTAGDVVSIDRANGKVSKLGRSYARAKDFDAMGPEVRFVACPEGELQRRQDTVNTVTLHDVDVVNSRTQGFLALFSGDTGEIKAEVREQIDKRIQEWGEEGRVEAVIPGVLFIDEAHCLDLEAFSFLNRALDSDLAPLLVLASNRGMAPVRGSDSTLSPHGFPADLLDRALIIATTGYSREEMRAILAVRAEEEDGPAIGPAAMDRLEAIAEGHSLRYALQLITTSGLVARRRRHSDLVEVGDIDMACSLFSDAGQSAMET